jgi:hypothetical protein
MSEKGKYLMPVEPITATIDGQKEGQIILKAWWQTFGPAEQEEIKGMTGRATELLNFNVPVGFLEAFPTCWDEQEHVWRIATHELMPTLEEVEALTNLSLNGNHAEVTTGNMEDQFLNILGFDPKLFLRRKKLLGHQNYKIDMDFLESRYGNKKYFYDYKKDFRQGMQAREWFEKRKDAFMICLISWAYFSGRNQNIDCAVAMILQEMKLGKTVVPVILSDILSSLYYCKRSEKAEFEGSLLILYMWTMSHLVASKRKADYLEVKVKINHFCIKPKRCKGKKDWENLFKQIQPEDITLFSEVAPYLFFEKTPHFPYIPLAGLRRMSGYVPARVACQFHKAQQIPPDCNYQEYFKKIKEGNSRMLRDVYAEWKGKELATPDEEDMEAFSEEYLGWLYEQNQTWNTRSQCPEDQVQQSNFREVRHSEQQLKKVVEKLTKDLNQKEEELQELREQRRQFHQLEKEFTERKRIWAKETDKLLGEVNYLQDLIKRKEEELIQIRDRSHKTDDEWNDLMQENEYLTAERDLLAQERDQMKRVNDEYAAFSSEQVLTYLRQFEEFRIKSESEKAQLMKEKQQLEEEKRQAWIATGRAESEQQRAWDAYHALSDPYWPAGGAPSQYYLGQGSQGSYPPGSNHQGPRM